jgi:hypothetical protein
MITNVNPAKNFARIIVNSDKGLVSNNSSVPFFFSSANIRIVMAGIRNRYRNGPIRNKPSRPAYL